MFSWLSAFRYVSFVGSSSSSLSSFFCCLLDDKCLSKCWTYLCVMLMYPSFLRHILQFRLSICLSTWSRDHLLHRWSLSVKCRSKRCSTYSSLLLEYPKCAPSFFSKYYSYIWIYGYFWLSWPPRFLCCLPLLWWSISYYFEDWFWLLKKCLYIKFLVIFYYVKAFG